IRVWVRLPGIPLENFDVGILTLVGNKIGKTVRVDGTTLFGARGNYVRVCVEIDPHKPLVSKYRLHCRVEYEGLHKISFECGRYGQGKSSCSTLRVQEQEEPTNNVFYNPMFGDNLERPEIVDDFGPWMLAKKNTRRKRNLNKANGDKSVTPINQDVPLKGSRFNVLVDDDTGDAADNSTKQDAKAD
ncbi:hypothetical protein LINPERHAP1_LOCUS19150, partial [Linum perenne]